MAKMFVHYSKTKAEFISAGLPSTYNNHIVFIKGDANGNGSCIYTHGVYFANMAELISALNFVKGIKVGTQSYNAAQGGGYIAFNAADPATVSVNAGSNGVEIGLTPAFINKVSTIEQTLSTVSSDYLKAADAETLRQYADQAELDAISSAKDYTDQEIGKLGDSYDAKGAASTAEGNAKTYTDQEIVKAKAYADGLASNYDASGAAATVQGKLDEEVTRAKAAEKANADAIASEKARLDAFLKDADASEKAVDTLVEIQEYIDTHGEAAATMTSNISKAQAAADKAQEEVDALELVVNTLDSNQKNTAGLLNQEITDRTGAINEVKGIIETQVSSLNTLIGNETTRAQQAEQNIGKAITDHIADKIVHITAEERTAWNGKVDKSVYDEKVAELAAMWEWEEL